MNDEYKVWSEEYVFAWIVTLFLMWFLYEVSAEDAVVDRSSPDCYMGVRFIGKSRDIEIQRCDGHIEVLRGEDADRFIFGR